MSACHVSHLASLPVREDWPGVISSLSCRVGPTLSVGSGSGPKRLLRGFPLAWDLRLCVPYACCGATITRSIKNPARSPGGVLTVSLGMKQLDVPSGHPAKLRTDGVASTAGRVAS